jgi:hypothetical protein
VRVIRAEQLTRAGADATAGLERHCTSTATCRIADVTMELRTDIPEVARIFTQRYAHHEAQSPADFRYYVATSRGGYTFWCAHASTWRWTQGPLPAEAVAFLADSVALTALIRFDSALSSFPAAGFELNGSAGAIAGGNAAAKATTLLACSRRGMRVYSDERVLLRGGIVYPLVRRSSVRAAGSRLLLGDREGDRKSDALQATPSLSPQTCFGAEGMAKPGPLRALFVIAGIGYCAALEAVDTASVLPEIVRGYDARGDMVDRVARAITTLNGVQSYKLTLGTPDESAAAVSYAMMRVSSR